jgi:hypothetical protein
MFAVIAPASDSVSKWRKSIYLENQNYLKGYDVRDLTLWKVRPLYSLHLLMHRRGLLMIS